MNVWSRAEMKKNIFILLFVVLTILSCGRKAEDTNMENEMNKKYSDFWVYFKSVEGKAENISKLSPEEQKEFLDGIKAKLINIDYNLDIELSGEKKEVFVTSGGIKSSFSSVKNLAASAPENLGWKVNAFRQRKELPFTLTVDKTLSVNSDDLLFKVSEDGEYLNIKIFFEGQEALQDEQQKQVMFVFLDGIIGEYDTETYIGTIDIESGPDDTFMNAEKFRETVDIFKKKSAKAE